MRILLIGYYGKGNFGDDVLFKVTYSYVRKWQPTAEIYVLCDQYQEDYLKNLVEGPMTIVQPGNRDNYDLIVHGGGGTFFDFKRYGIFSKFINTFMNTIGFKNSIRIENILRRILKRSRISSDKRVGWGIGVGTYTAGSKKLRDNLPTLLDFNTLIVRDSISVENLKKLGIEDNVKLGSDLAFLDAYWVPKEEFTQNESCERTKLGLILRDWQTGDENTYLDSVEKVLPHLNETYDLTIFIFDKRTDKKVLELAKDYNICLWDPIVMSFEEFCFQLKSQDVLVTSRAHGSICGAVLGLPSVIIELEPKLKTIHEMLPNSTSLIGLDQFSLKSLKAEIKEVLKSEKETIVSDCLYNKKLIENEVFLSIK